MIKDSGNRTAFNSGAVRDMKKGKGRFDLLPFCTIMRLAKHYEAGAEKYGVRNWELGVDAYSCMDSGLRHLMKWHEGWDDEDHLIAAIWNLIALAWYEENKFEVIEKDIPKRKGKKVYRYTDDSGDANV